MYVIVYAARALIAEKSRTAFVSLLRRGIQMLAAVILNNSEKRTGENFWGTCQIV
jgi:hypothetical protein